MKTFLSILSLLLIALCIYSAFVTAVCVWDMHCSFAPTATMLQMVASLAGVALFGVAAVFAHDNSK